jgi:poly-gamma-glutamate synthesis protein (capsule biosynthesis protein)
LNSYSGVVSDAYDKRQTFKTKPGYQKTKWFTDDEKYWISVLPKMVFLDDKLVQLYLYPIELGMKKPRSQRGRPMMTNKKVGKKILNIIKKLSEPYGTDIKIIDNVGIVQL